MLRFLRRFRDAFIPALILGHIDRKLAALVTHFDHRFEHADRARCAEWRSLTNQLEWIMSKEAELAEVTARIEAGVAALAPKITAEATEVTAAIDELKDQIAEKHGTPDDAVTEQIDRLSAVADRLTALGESVSAIFTAEAPAATGGGAEGGGEVPTE